MEMLRNYASARVQGRPARDGNVAGPDSIVRGLRKAVQGLRSTNVTRKDIAWFAGVTPALVTYYFPDRDRLVEAATLPVIDTFSTLIAGHLAADVDREEKLLLIVEDTLSLYCDSHYLVELVQQTDKLSLMPAIWREVAAFFDVWPGRTSQHARDGSFFTAVLFGTCHALSSRLMSSQGLGHDPEASRQDQATMIHRMMISALSASADDPAATL